MILLKFFWRVVVTKRLIFHHVRSSKFISAVFTRKHILLKTYTFENIYLFDLFQEEAAIAQRNFFRNFISKVFQFLVWICCVRTIKDTQCGFKLFSRTEALTLFSILHVERWAFDVELLYLAENLG